MGKKGITLVELMIVITLFAVLVGAGFWIFVVGLDVWDSGKDRNQLRVQSGLSLEVMVRELAQASSITNAAAGTITFVADLNDDSVNETIMYYLNGNKLTRQEASTDQVLAEDTNTFTLVYRNTADTVVSLPEGADTQAERDTISVISLTLDMHKAEENFTLSSSVFLRNR